MWYYRKNMRRKVEIILFLLFLGVFAASVYSAYYTLNDGFFLGNIVSDFHDHLEAEVISSPQDEERVREILAQSFHYIGKGGQAYAFESRDREHVIKFYRFSRNKNRFVNSLFSYIPFSEDRCIHEIQRKMKKAQNYFSGYKVMFNASRESAAIEYLHCNPTINKFGMLKIYDKIGREHVLDLDQMAFIIQRKGIPFDVYLRNELDQGNISNACLKIQEVLDFLNDHYRKGLYDQDYGVMHNLGFVDNRPIFIDLGKMTFDKVVRREDDIRREIDLVSERMKAWINKEYPNYSKRLCSVINSYGESG